LKLSSPRESRNPLTTERDVIRRGELLTLGDR
jgi:hypothetical protein